MRKEEAQAEAVKRNAHKNPTLVHKKWHAVFKADRGVWGVTLVDDQSELARQKQDDALRALRNGDLDRFCAAAGDALLARCRATIGDAP